MVYALDAQDQLVAVTDYCDFPPEAAEKPSIGGVENPSLEALASHRPGLVLFSQEGGNRRSLSERLDTLGIAWFLDNAHSVDDVLFTFERLGKALGREKEAASLLEDWRSRLLSLQTRLEGRARPTVFYPIWQDPLVAPGKNTFLDDALTLAGGINIAARAGEGWPALGWESLLTWDPDIIVLPENSQDKTLGDLKNHPRWRTLRAVREGKIIRVNGDRFERPGPRLVAAIEDLAKKLHPEAFNDSKAEQP